MHPRAGHWREVRRTDVEELARGPAAAESVAAVAAAVGKIRPSGVGSGGSYGAPLRPPGH